MITGLQAGEVVDGRVRKRGVRRATVGDRRAMVAAIGAALLLVLVLSLAVTRVLAPSPPGDTAETAPWGYASGFETSREDHRGSDTAALPSRWDYREERRGQDAPVVPGFTDYREEHRQRAQAHVPNSWDYREDHRTP